MPRTRRLAEFLRGLDDPAQRRISPDPRQRPARYFTGLTAQPYHDASRFACSRVLERGFARIRREIGPHIERLQAEPSLGELVDSGAWSRLPLFDHGARHDDGCRLCPETTRLVSSIDGALAAGLVYFSALRPGTRIAPHCGPHNARLRCHLPLFVPAGACLTVGGVVHHWREGACVMFDDSFEHVASNPSAETRVVLVVDIWHPELAAFERRALSERFARDLGPRPAAPAYTGALHAFSGESQQRVGGHVATRDVDER